jgi:hypothetical protein
VELAPVALGIIIAVEDAPRFWAAEAWRALGCPYETATALSDLDDVAALREAHETLERLDARPLADRVARRLREKGVRTRCVGGGPRRADPPPRRPGGEPAT